MNGCWGHKICIPVTSLGQASSNGDLINDSLIPAVWRVNRREEVLRLQMAGIHSGCLCACLCLLYVCACVHARTAAVHPDARHEENIPGRNVPGGRKGYGFGEVMALWQKDLEWHWAWHCALISRQQEARAGAPDRKV